MGANYKTPPTMDWNQAMEKDLASGREGVTSATEANRVNQNNPFGSLTWAKDPTTGQWTQNVSLNPGQQQQLQNQQSGLAATSGQASQIMQGGLGLGGQMNMSGAPGFWSLQPQGQVGTPGFQQPQANINAGLGLQQPNANVNAGLGLAQPSADVNAGLGLQQPDAGWGSVESIQNAMLSRMQPAMQQRQEAEQARLKAQGITEGSEAWNRAMTQQGQASNDMQMQALLAGEEAANRQFGREQQVYGNLRGEGTDLFNRQFNQGQQQYQNLRGEGTDLFNRQFNQGQQQYQNLRGEGTDLYNRQWQQGTYGNQLADQDFANRLQAQGQQWNQNLQGSQATAAQRQQMLAEQQAMRNQQMQELGWMMGGAVQNPEFQGFYQQGAMPGSNYSGALNEYYKQALMGANAANAQNSQNTQAGVNIGGQVLGGLLSNPGFTKWVSGLFGG